MAFTIVGSRKILTIGPEWPSNASAGKAIEQNQDLGREWRIKFCQIKKQAWYGLSAIRLDKHVEFHRMSWYHQRSRPLAFFSFGVIGQQ